jgi:Ca2+-binding RTX toxin-like protein
VCEVEDTAPVAIVLSGTDSDGTITGFHIVSLPTNGTLALNPDGSSPVAVDDIIPNGTSVYFIPDANWSGTASFDYAAIDNDNAEDLTPATATVHVAPVADTPTLDLDSGTLGDQHSGTASGNVGDAIALDINAALTDTDGSETLGITITGVPSGATLSAGTYDLGTDTWTLTGAELAGLTISGAAAGGYTLTVNAISTEATPDFAVDDPTCDDTSDNVATTSGSIDLTVNSVGGGSDGDPPSDLYFNVDLGKIDNGTFLNAGVDLGGFTGNSDGTISWAITGLTASNDATPPAYFTIDPVTGELTVGAVNIPEGIYTLTIEATDSDGSTSTDLIIAVGTPQADDFTSLSSSTDQVIVAALAGADDATTGTNDDTLVGGAGNDTLLGGAGADTILGGGNNDIIRGGSGADVLTGGGGNDTFVYTAASDSLAGFSDQITDFDQGHDHIDLSALGVTSFNGDSTAPGAHQVTYHFDGTNTIVYVDTDGVAGADMEITVLGNIALTNTDFVGL